MECDHEKAAIHQLEEQMKPFQDEMTVKESVCLFVCLVLNDASTLVDH